MTNTEPDDTPQRPISWPTILRLRSTLESVRAELRDLTPDAKSLERLASIHNTIQSALGDAVSVELEIELAEFSSCCENNPSPTQSEIKVAQAQLSGWIQGLLNGVVLAEANARAQAAPQPLEQAPERPGYNPAGYV